MKKRTGSLWLITVCLLGAARLGAAQTVTQVSTLTSTDQVTAQLLAELPPSVDPCGERGEFHTFATHAPTFSRPIDVTAGEVVERDGFVFADLLPSV